MTEAITHAAAVAVIACLISESILLHKIRHYFNWYLLECPICLGFWLAAPALYYGVFHYFLVIAFSNVWMLVILKVYEVLDASTNTN